MMTEEQLKAMEASAPLLVAEVRRLQVREKDLMAARNRAEEDVHRMNKVRESLSVLLNVALGGDQ